MVPVQKLLHVYLPDESAVNGCKWMMTASTLEHCIHIAKQDEPSSLLLMASQRRRRRRGHRDRRRSWTNEIARTPRTMGYLTNRADKKSF